MIRLQHYSTNIDLFPHDNVGQISCLTNYGSLQNNAYDPKSNPGLIFKFKIVY